MFIKSWWTRVLILVTIAVIGIVQVKNHPHDALSLPRTPGGWFAMVFFLALTALCIPGRGE